jgi:predicted PurR-regulated permease PerM
MPDPIKRETLFAAALLVLIAAVLVLFYRVMASFLVPLAWSAIIVVTIHPLYVRFRGRVRPNGLAAFLMTTIVALLIIAPLTYLVIALLSEARSLYDIVQERLAQENLTAINLSNHPFVRSLTERLEGVVDTSKWDLKSVITDALQSVSKFVVEHTASFITNVGVGLFQFVLILLSTYYLFKDGERLMDQLRESIPLPDDRSTRILTHVTDVVRATIHGGLVVAAIQGALGGIMFWILGIPSPVFWGAVMAFFALIPFLGAFVVYLPAAVWLVIAGSYIKAIILVVFGIAIVSQIDNFLKPILISGRTQMHPLLLFFSILGGIQAFGFLGVVLGPVIAAVFVGVFDLYRHSLKLPRSQAGESP